MRRARVDWVDLVLLFWILLALAIAGTIEANDPPPLRHGIAPDQQRIMAQEYNARAVVAGGPVVWRE